MLSRLRPFYLSQFPSSIFLILRSEGLTSPVNTLLKADVGR